MSDQAKPQRRHVDPVVLDAFRAVEPPGFCDDPEWSLEAADVEVQDSIGGE